jgi:hypothetical protein
MEDGGSPNHLTQLYCHFIPVLEAKLSTASFQDLSSIPPYTPYSLYSKNKQVRVR